MNKLKAAESLYKLFEAKYVGTNVHQGYVPVIECEEKLDAYLPGYDIIINKSWTSSSSFNLTEKYLKIREIGEKYIKKHKEFNFDAGIIDRENSPILYLLVFKKSAKTSTGSNRKSC